MISKSNRNLVLRPELSAQGIRKHINPILRRALEAVRSENGSLNGGATVVDCGCGQLRHAQMLTASFSKTILVDTPYQLKTIHNFHGKKMLISDFVKKHWPLKNIKVMTTSEFEISRIEADVIVSVNVFDVVPKRTRRSILRSCYRNLGAEGRFVIIAPRNDFWTKRICTRYRRYRDGYLFRHPNGLTYYRNWGGDSLRNEVEAAGYIVTQDLSIHRQVCLICKASSD